MTELDPLARTSHAHKLYKHLFTVHALVAYSVGESASLKLLPLAAAVAPSTV